MSRRAVISSSIFVVLLLAFVLTREDRVRVGVRTLSLPSIGADDVTGIELSGAFQLRLLREGEDWSVRDPADPERGHPADAQLVERALKEIETLETGAYVTARVEKQAELEIDEALGTTITISREGGEPLSLVVGREAKNGGTFLRRRDSNEVFVTPGALASSLKRELNAWRKRDLVSLSMEEIESLRIETTEGSTIEIVASSSPAGGWELASDTELPTGFSADPEGLAARVRAFTSFRAVEFVDLDPGDPTTGLGEGATRAVARTRDGKELALRFGAAGEAARVHVQREPEPQVYLVPAGVANPFRDGLEALRDLSLFRFDANAVRGFRIQHPSGVVVLERQEDAPIWQLVDPASPPLDYEFSSDAVISQLQSLARTRATGFLGSDASLDSTFSRPVELEFRLADGDTVNVQLGEVEAGVDHARPGDGFTYAVGGGLRSRFETPLDLFRRVEAPPEAPGLGNMGGGGGLENLPPDLRRQIEEAMRNQQRGAP